MALTDLEEQDRIKELLGTQEGRVQLAMEIRKPIEDQLMRAKIERLYGTIQQIPDEILAEYRKEKLETAYRHALMDWDFHKHDCKLCGTFGEPSGCEPGQFVWTSLRAAALNRREMLDAQSDDLSGVQSGREPVDQVLGIGDK